MERTPGSKHPRKKDADRDERLKAALKANMARRKAQARARQAQGRNEDSGQKDDR